ncbi:MAG: hypothetical protein WC654_02795 [Patescibacteria group bacterium]
MRIVETEPFGNDFFKMLSRQPGDITLTLKSGEVVTGVIWTLFKTHMILNDLGSVTEIPYDQIETYTAIVDLGFPFGQHLTQGIDDPGWSVWEQRRDLEFFIECMLANREIKFSMVDPTCDTFVNGKVFTVGSDGTITLAGGAISVTRKKIVWVCHKLPG